MIADEIERTLQEAASAKRKPVAIRLSQAGYDELVDILPSAMGPYDRLALKQLSYKGVPVSVDPGLSQSEVRVDTDLDPQQ